MGDGRDDLERAVAELAERLPRPLAPLARVAFNYWWSWSRDGEEVFREVDPDLWRRCGANPLCAAHGSGTPPYP